MILFPVKYTGLADAQHPRPCIFRIPFFQLQMFQDETGESRGRQPAWNGITSPSPCRARAAASKLRTFPAVRVVHPRTALFIHTGSIESSPASAGSPPCSPEQKHGQGVFLPIIRYHFGIISINIAHGIVNCLHFRPSSPSSSDPACRGQLQCTGFSGGCQPPSRAFSARF